MSEKMFDFAIGNPPYNEEFSVQGNKTYASPVYNIFMDAANDVADKIELIHPARFLFNAGSTPKAWNEKMLNDKHFKILYYEEDATKIFPNTEIKGGAAISYYDHEKDFGAIQIFTKFKELNEILHKVLAANGFESISKVVITRTAYRLTEKLHEDYPNAVNQLSDGHKYDMSTNIFDRLPEVFSDVCPTDGRNYIRILGRKDNERVYKYIRRDYVNKVKNLDKYKAFLSKANGSGVFGETLTPPIIAFPGDGNTETFVGIGMFDTEAEAKNATKYLQTKFARALLGILKTTQDITPEKFSYIPLQDFTSSSDIDWSQSIAEIDQHLYQKYNLSPEEIDFIEKNVKEMA